MDGLLWFGVLVQAFIVCIMLAIGLQLLPRELAGVLRDRNFLLRTLVINLILIPFSAILLLYFFELPSSLSIAIVLIAAAPGAPFGPRIVELTKGSLSHGVAAVLILAGLSVVSGPLIARWLLTQPGVEVVGTAGLIISLIAFQLLPIVLGIWLRRQRPRLSDRLLRPLHLSSNILISIIAVFVILSYREQLFSIGWENVGILALITVSWTLFGWLFGGRDARLRLTQGMVAPARNLGMAFLMALSGYGDQEVLLLLMIQGGMSLFLVPVLGRLYV